MHTNHVHIIQQILNYEKKRTALMKTAEYTYMHYIALLVLEAVF